MKAIVFDTGPIISLALNDLLWTLPVLKEKYGGDFYLPHSVKLELIDKPMNSKKYKFEAMNILKLINKGVLKVHDKIEIHNYLHLANSIYSIGGRKLKLVHGGELEAFVLANQLKADLCAIDERTMRLLVEDANKLRSLLERKFHTKVQLNRSKLNEFKEKVCCVSICRTTELMAIAYESGLFKDFDGIKKRDFLDGLFWALKLRGVSISGDEIGELISAVR